MKKKISITCVCITLILICTVAIVHAENGPLSLFSSPTTMDDTAEVFICITDRNHDLDAEKQNQVLSIAANYESILTATNKTLDRKDSSAKVLGQFDNTINEEFYEIQKTDCSIALSKDLDLRSFTDNTFDYNASTTTDRATSRKFILDIFTKLNLSADYTLTNIEEFGDNLWEAVFAKEIDGLINYYDSIKIYFCPLQKKIAALRVHSTTYVEDPLSTYSSTISTEKAQDIVLNTFVDVSKDNIVSIDYILTKPNNFFTRKSGEDIVSQNKVVKAWCITLEKDTTYTVYIDTITGNIIGGDCTK